jgi:hypothetical protein
VPPWVFANQKLAIAKTHFAKTIKHMFVLFFQPNPTTLLD